MITKFLLRWFLSLLLTVTLLSVNLLSVNAQTSKVRDDVISFLTLGEQDNILTGPLDSWETVFRLPADWTIPSDNSILHLNLNAVTGMASNNGVVGFLEVSLNQTWLTTINLSSDGEYSVDIPIPSNAWATTARNASQVLTLTLVDVLDCQMWISASTNGDSVRGLSAVIRSSSYIDFKHDTMSVSTDLKLFPYPLFQNTFKPDDVVLVIPDQPTQGEMQAAMTMSAVFGRLTNNNFTSQLITLSQLTDSLILESNLVFIGAPASFPQLNKVNLPAPFNGTSFDNVQMGTDDGILQMIKSPQNTSKVWLLISGNSDAAVIKAAQAIGSGQIQPYGPENLAIITGIGSDNQDANKTDITFEDLGYPFEQTYTGTYNDLGIWFDMPANQMASEGAYFEMVFANSAILDFDASDVEVSINDNLIGGLRFSDRTTSITHWKFNIPTNLLHPGRNLLLLQLTLSGSSPCIPPDELWFSINPDSLLHLPTSVIASNTNRDFDLTNYPNSTFSTFDRTVLVLPSNDTFSWSVASKLSFDLGRKLGGSNINIATYFADAIPDDILKARDLIIVGRPSAMPIITQFSQVMPAPFEKGSDIAQEKKPQYSFLVTDNTPVGYVQVFSPPWDSTLTVLTISGNTDEGLDAAAVSLLSPSYRGQMVGNFVVVLNNKIIVQKVDVATTSQTSPQVILPGGQKPDDTGKTEDAGKFNISLPVVVLIVLIVLVAIGVIVFFVMEKDDNHEKGTGNSKDKDVSEEKKSH